MGRSQSHPARSIPRPTFVSTRGNRVHISHQLFGGQPHKSVDLCVAAAYELGRELIDHAEGLLAGVRRPWDDDPDRPPFASRRYGRAGVRVSAADAAGGARAGSRTPGSRPTRPMDSGA